MEAFRNINDTSRVLVVGASGGIGSALVMALGNVCGMSNVVTLSRSADGVDIVDETALAEFALTQKDPFDAIVVATGALEVDGLGPEKTIKTVDRTKMLAQFEVNAVGPALVLKHFHPLLAKDRRSVFAILTARVGSIGDNHLGGWLSYRTAKAAANQVLRTASIEIGRKFPHAICVALHPGTVQTELTQKFVEQTKATPPDIAAQNLLRVIDRLSEDDSGRFFDWQGLPVEW